MTYDTWKATEPDYGDERPEEGEEEVNMDPRHLDLTDGKQESPGGDPHRPRISVWIDENEGEPRLTMSIDALWGQPQRFVELRPPEARKLARHLNELAGLKDENDRLLEALRPFSRWYELNDCDGRDGVLEVPITDIRNAHAAYKSID